MSDILKSVGRYLGNKTKYSICYQTLKVNSIERMQEKMFLALENQGHVLRDTMETILTEVCEYLKTTAC